MPTYTLDTLFTKIQDEVSLDYNIVKNTEENEVIIDVLDANITVFIADDTVSYTVQDANCLDSSGFREIADLLEIIEAF